MTTILAVASKLVVLSSLGSFSAFVEIVDWYSDRNHRRQGHQENDDSAEDCEESLDSHRERLAPIHSWGHESRDGLSL